MTQAIDERAVAREVLQLTQDLADLYDHLDFRGEAHGLKVEMTRATGIGYRAKWSLGAGENGVFLPYDGIKYVRAAIAKLQATLSNLAQGVRDDRQA